MNRITLICLLVVLTLPSWSTAGTAGPARIRFLQGETLYRTPDSEEWLQPTVNTPLDEGDIIWCADNCKVELQLPDGSITRLDGGSQLDILANEDGFIHLHLATGHMYLKTNQALKENSLQIDADDTTVLPSAGTRLRIDMMPNYEEDVAITKGSAYVEGNGSRTRVRAGEQILLEEGHNEILPLKPADDWELWNVARDREQSRAGKPDSYLPEELRSYSRELDSNGRWINVPEYGYVWRPTVVISSDWAPYRSGRWIWRGDDYIWLSFESWGWAPYHFGRWAVVSGFGWCWVPPERGDVYWGPGYVGWYRSGNRVGWTPLAPKEIFYGRRNYGRHSVNITNVTVNINTINYKNRNYSGGLTVVPQRDFLRGKTTVQRADRSTPISVSVEGPRVRPVRETRMPVIKSTPPRVAPPRIEQRDPRELRNKFPRVTPNVNEVQRQRPQGSPAVVTPPAPPSGRAPQIREKQTSFPISTPADRTTASPPVNQPQQPVAQQRTPQSQPQQQHAAPPQNAPQRIEQPRQSVTPATTPSVPSTAPVRVDTRQNLPPAQVKTPRAPQVQQAVPPARAESQRREQAQQKKVWRVTTPESAPEKDIRIIEPKGGDPRTNDGRGNENRGNRERR